MLSLHSRRPIFCHSCHLNPFMCRCLRECSKKTSPGTLSKAHFCTWVASLSPARQPNMPSTIHSQVLKAGHAVETLYTGQTTCLDPKCWCCLLNVQKNDLVLAKKQKYLSSNQIMNQAAPIDQALGPSNLMQCSPNVVVRDQLVSPFSTKAVRKQSSLLNDHRLRPIVIKRHQEIQDASHLGCHEFEAHIGLDLEYLGDSQTHKARQA